ncbi:hypothetical protein TNCT_628871, partial [Trichonephila clavata]
LDATLWLLIPHNILLLTRKLYKQSLELLKLKKPPEVQPQAVDVC